eukprot:4112529-Prymnesium_polylepis.1
MWRAGEASVCGERAGNLDGDGDAPPLASREAAHVGVADLPLGDVGEAERGERAVDERICHRGGLQHP